MPAYRVVQAPCRAVIKVVCALMLCLFMIAGMPHASRAQAPSAPTGLATVSHTSQVMLSWSAVANAVTYNVYRGDTTGMEAILTAGTSVSGTSFTDTVPNATHYYYYQVTAVNASGEGSRSAETVAIPLAAPVVTARAGNNQVTLSWGTVGNAYVYNISRGASTNTETPLAAGVGGLSYTDTTAANGTPFFYKVTAARNPNESDPSGEVSATPSATLPGSPVLTATPTSTQIVLSWSAVAGATSYKVKRSTVRGYFSAVLASPTAANYTDTTPVANTTYYYVVTAVIGSTESANSNQVVASVPSGNAVYGVADAYVEQDTPTTNYGAVTSLYGLASATAARSRRRSCICSEAAGRAPPTRFTLFRTPPGPRRGSIGTTSRRLAAPWRA